MILRGDDFNEFFDICYCVGLNVKLFERWKSWWSFFFGVFFV